MLGQGKVVGFIAVVLFILLALTSYVYTQDLASQREVRIDELMSMEQYEHCLYDASTCPQIENSVQVPNILGIAVLVLAIILAGYLWRSDNLQQSILQELRRSDDDVQEKERLELVLSVLKEDEKKTVLAIREQPGITQHTLRLRTDFSKAKLSSILKELESRELVKKEEDGKTNKLYLKRKL